MGVVPRRNLALAGALSIAVAASSLGLGFITTQRLAAASGGDGSATPPPLPDIGGLAPTPSTAVASPQTSAGPVSTLPPPLGGAVPVDLIPALTEARDDLPAIYRNGCHLAQEATAIPECAFGDVDSGTVVMLFGDSHAAQWFPALERLATDRAWRLISVTKSGCTPASITVWNTNLKRAYTECDDWRAAVLARAAIERPKLVIVASSHPYPPAGNGAPAPPDDGVALAAGLQEILERLRSLAGAVVLIGDTPKFGDDPPECLASHLDSMLECAEPRTGMIDETWRQTEAALAQSLGATFVDPTDWACPTDPCSPVVGRYLVYRDTHHLATPYVAALRERLAALLPSVVGP